MKLVSTDGPKISKLWAIFFVASLSGCATAYESTALRSWPAMRSGQVDGALEAYEKEVNDPKDALLRQMDEGILLRTAGRYEESNQSFFQAAKTIEASGYLSLGEQTATLLTNEKQTTYQGEDFEKVLIHLYLGLNFIALNQFEAALVETRRVNEILFKMISEGKRPYELNAFARYLGGMLFEEEGNENDAYVAYQNTLKINPDLENEFAPIAIDLMRMAKRMAFVDDLETLRKKFGEEYWKQAESCLKKKCGALVLLFENGKSPKKYSSKEGRRSGTVDVLIPVAHYMKRPSQIAGALIEVDSQKAPSAVLTDIEKTAAQHLKDRMGRAVAKALLVAATKTAVAVSVGKATKSKELGFLTGLALFMASDADTRSWLLLPAKLQIAKVFLPPGKYSLKISYLDRGGSSLQDEVVDVQVRANHHTFVQRRAFD